MDFMTTVPYWGILIIVILNAFLVSRQQINITQDEEG